MLNVEDELVILLKEYVKNINTAMKLMYQRFLLKNNNDVIDLRTKYHGYIEIEEGIYIFHGGGCRFESNEFYVDFQFGGKKHYGGIEPNTFCICLEETHPFIYQKYNSNMVKEKCEELVEKRVMYKDQFYFFKDEIHL